MLTNTIPNDCTPVMVQQPNIHDILTHLEAVLSETNEKAWRIRNFLVSQPMAKNEPEPGGATDMISHVTDINEMAIVLQDRITDIAQILGL